MLKTKITPIIQARMNSQRFPGKALKKIGKNSMLFHVIEQTKNSKYVDDVIVATTHAKNDKQIIDFCKKNNIQYFLGSNTNVLDRYFKCASKFSLDPVVRISSDCPFLDPTVIDKVIRKYLKNSFDYVSNNFESTISGNINSLCNFPQGMVVEISSYKALKRAWKEAKKPSDLEHVFPYIQFNPQKFKISNIKNKKNLSHIRCTVDLPQDLKFIKKIWKEFPKNRKIVTINDIVSIIDLNPSLIKINNHTSFDEGYKKSLLKDNKLNNNK
ncbi:glycosyltransferase family protein [Nitrosopumilus sp.]|uniref:glycosyltransferase family protein n=1 Tax=Nitrosopumilus sp. TaxID=2024843 RepID=UPI002605CDE6|nr:glycosyltransferase family protein [Nitrosopumilus sp.]